MKIVFIIDNNRTIGGAEYAQCKYAQELAKRNHEVLIFAGDKNFLTKELALEDNIKMYNKRSIPIFKKKIGLGTLNTIWSKIYEKIVVERLIKSYKPDWIIGYLRTAAISASSVGKKCNVPVANFIFENPVWMKDQLGELWEKEWSNTRFRNSWMSAKKAYSESHVLIPCSKLAGVKFLEWLPDATISQCVYPGVDPIVVKDKEKIFDFIYVGRLNALKNVDDFFRAAAKMGKNYSLLVIGSGEEEVHLKNMAKELNLTVTFLGTISDKEKWNYLYKSKVMVFPSSFEGFGIPPLEALVAGCQVICSDIPIFKEIYADSVFYFTLHDIDGLASLMTDVISKRKIISVSKNISKKYSWTQAAIHIENILEEHQ